MKRKKRRETSALMTIGFLTIVVLCRAAYAADKPFESSICMIPRCDELSQENHLYIMNAEKLGLSDEQIKELREIENECDRAFLEERARLRVARLDLYEILESDRYDMEALKDKTREISEIVSSLILRRTTVKVKAMMVLTEEQKKKARKLLKR